MNQASKQASKKSRPDGQKARSLATQHALMEAAEKLAASRGMQNVSKKDIIREAGQKNESVLQYHFGSLQGLINAIHKQRNGQTQEKRSELLAELLSSGHQPILRDLCKLMVMPTFLMAQSDRKFRRYIVAFSQEVALAQDSAFDKVSQSGGGGESGQITGELLRAALPHLDTTLYRARMEMAVRMVSASIGHHARQKNAFRGESAALFLNNLIDALEGVLSAPVSQETDLAHKKGQR